MSVTLTIAGTSYVYPSIVSGVADEEWGDNATDAMVAACANALWKDGSVALTADWDAGSFKITAETFESDVATGTAPFTVASTTEVANLKAATCTEADSVEGTAVKSTGEAGATKFLREDGDGTCSWQTVSTTNPPLNIDFPAGSFSYPAANPAPLDSDTDGTAEGILFRQLFDDSTEEYVQGVFQIPSDVDTTGNLTFEVYGYAVTADGNEVQYRVGWKALADGEDWGVAYADSDSGDQTTDGTQDQLDYFTWTLAASNFAANDFVRFQLSRIAIDDGTPVSGDYGVIHFRIRIPRT